MSLNEVIANVKEKNIQLPDELSVVNKWDILLLLVPGLTKDKVTTQKKNYSKLKKDNMLFLCIDTIVRMFLDMIYLDSRPDMPHDRIGLRSFKYLIKNKIDEFEDLEEEFINLKEGKGYMLQQEHNEEIRMLNNNFKNKEEEYKNRIQKLENTEIYLREKIEKVEERIEAKLEMKYKGWAPTATEEQEDSQDKLS